ncbi:hypothetical protein TNCV_4264831 [Trichonephila clavipes]|nr:hypothetical protein TNCV_4264831 [Trichonephila clavipes]
MNSGTVERDRFWQRLVSTKVIKSTVKFYEWKERGRMALRNRPFSKKTGGILCEFDFRINSFSFQCLCRQVKVGQKKEMGGEPCPGSRELEESPKERRSGNCSGTEGKTMNAGGVGELE